MKVLSTRAHGVLDYLMAGVLLLVPWLLNWSDATKTLLTILALGIVLYSLITRYELGAFRVLPMGAHLALDMLGGAVLIIAAMVLTREPDGVQWTLGLLGLAEIGAAAMTDPSTNSVPGMEAGSVSRTRSPGL